MSKPTKQPAPLADNPSPTVRAKLLTFADLYRGGPEELRGNATACYQRLHPTCTRETARNRATAYLRHPIVQEQLAERAQALSEEADITQTYVLTTIRDTLERCRQGEPVRDAMGNPVTIETEDGEIHAVYKFDPTNVMRGCELLGKNLKMWTDKVEASVEGGRTLAELMQQARDESK